MSATKRFRKVPSAKRKADICLGYKSGFIEALRLGFGMPKGITFCRIWATRTKLAESTFERHWESTSNAVRAGIPRVEFAKSEAAKRTHGVEPDAKFLKKLLLGYGTASDVY